MNLLGEAIEWVFGPDKVESEKYDREAQNFSVLPEHFNPLFSVGFDGEKNPGEIGDVVRYKPEYTRLRNRAWKAFLDSDITQAIFNKYSLWVIGKGLKLQAEPLEDFLLQTAKGFDKKGFTKQVEARWKVYSKSKRASLDRRRNLHGVANMAFLNSIVAGDVLVVGRVDKKGNVTIQLIDADNVRTPMLGHGVRKSDTSGGFSISHGIVMDKNGVHIAYYVATKEGFTRIEATDRFGQLRAWMVYGLEYRIENIRGLPIITAVMETLAKLDRYKEATVGSAEERAKIIFSVEHGQKSTGETPMSKSLQASRDVASKVNSQEINEGKEAAALIAKTTNKQAFNMPVDSKLTMHAEDVDENFKEFISAMAMIVCATATIPMEVAFSKYDSNFSASRAALKDWEHVLDVRRDKFCEDFYKPIYSLWLNMQVMTGKIDNKELAESLRTGDWEVEEAIKQSRWIGANVPHIDPLKEVMAERLKLGALGEKLPLTTLDRALEALGSGDSSEILQRFVEELDKAKALPEIEPKKPDSVKSSAEGPDEG